MIMPVIGPPSRSVEVHANSSRGQYTWRVCGCKEFKAPHVLYDKWFRGLFQGFA